jgi:hypothetical protein
MNDKEQIEEYLSKICMIVLNKYLNCSDELKCIIQENMYIYYEIKDKLDKEYDKARNSVYSILFPKK